MFCFQCEQTAGCKACAGKVGVCGKKADTAQIQDKLTGALIGLARATEGNEHVVSDSTAAVIVEGLFATLTNVNFDNDALLAIMDKVDMEKRKLVPECYNCASSCGRNNDYDMNKLWNADEDIRSLKSLILFGIRGVAAYAYHAAVLGYKDESNHKFLYKALFAIGMDDWGMEELLPIVLEVGEVNLKCMAMLDKANTETFGHPEPTQVSLTIEKGPFIVITGHDLYDLKLLLEQTEGKGINIYTHGEMLPAHAYPELKKYPHLKGNFGTAWQNQQKEFTILPAPVLFTTNCLMPPKESYADRVFTTEVVGYPGMQHIGADKDFTPVIEKALELGGFDKDTTFPGINGGETVMTGFARNTVMSVAGTVIDAVKSGAIKHFFLVAGCDGARPGRNYYTEFVKQTPKDTVVLTLACGKYRFNDLDLGTIGGLPPAYGSRAVQRCLLCHSDCCGFGGPKYSSELVRAESCLHPVDPAASGHQEHPPWPHAARFCLSQCAEGAGGKLQHRPHYHPRRGSEGHPRLIISRPPRFLWNCGGFSVFNGNLDSS